MTINLDSLPVELIDAYFCSPLFEVVPQHCSSVMQESHNLAGKIQTLRLFSFICKHLHTDLHPRKQELISQLNNKLATIQNHPLDSRNFGEYAQHGYFIATLKIYYFFNPKALLNPEISLPETSKITPPIDMSLIKPMKCRGSVGGTILHNAVYFPNREKDLSPSFVWFILKLDKEHKLGLLEAKDSLGRTPLQLLETKIDPVPLEKFFFPTSQNFKKKQEAIEKHQKNREEIRKTFLSFLNFPTL
jgi:hypothetical protein